ncbi:8-oxoguanine deaminase [Allosaccharopolyspora coralli]|uniref:8-oxoguanine deaminase n=1 Tax=Allosaccharopolyspora coralli TaxID=2665642 RepID=A0A5Q3Q6A1_9PSEU|nr:8-oxoguanine deaminase [Allosaccharopolyspora coralli]QGK70128.1 8-oxoguanine deaminase [Allosaccharopolyspora coralli]
MTATARVVLTGAAIATVDAAGTEYDEGHVIVEGDRVVAVAPGEPEFDPSARTVDASGCLITPGLVNTHHHLYQWLTRGRAQQSPLFDWLTELYPAWTALDEENTLAAATAGLAQLALSGCTTAADHHYVFPRHGGDVAGSVVAAADRVGTRLHLVRGSMDRGRAHGGLPPESLVEDTDEALAGTEAAIDRFHDPAPNAAVRVAVGPCSPFSVSDRLMRESASLARRRGVRLHTHLAETTEEHHRCLAEFARTPVEYADELGWLGPDVWLAHGVHLSPAAVARLAATGTGVAHCPSSNARLAAGTAPVRDLLAADASVGLGVDGAASNEHGGLGDEIRQAMLVARLRDGAQALTAREALWLATAGGARCLGRQHELGSVEVGKLADLAVWRVDGIGHAGIADPVAALAFGASPPLELLIQGGRTLVEAGELTTVPAGEVARDLAAASAAFAPTSATGTAPKEVLR